MVLYGGGASLAEQEGEKERSKMTRIRMDDRDETATKAHLVYMYMLRGFRIARSECKNFSFVNYALLMT